MPALRILWAVHEERERAKKNRRELARVVDDADDGLEQTRREQEERTDGVSDLDEVRVVRDGDDEALEGSNGKREGKDLSIRVALSGPEGVLEEGVQDSTDPERGLDDVGSELADGLTAGLVGDGEVVGEELVRGSVGEGDRSFAGRQGREVEGREVMGKK
jgi:hypothetical protein